jgi:hypothetical protein
LFALHSFHWEGAHIAHITISSPLLVELHAAVGTPRTKKAVVNQDKSANACFNNRYDLGGVPNDDRPAGVNGTFWGFSAVGTQRPRGVPHRTIRNPFFS